MVFSVNSAELQIMKTIQSADLGLVPVYMQHESMGEQAPIKISSMVRLKSEPESANDIQAVRQAIDKKSESYDF